MSTDRHGPLTPTEERALFQKMLLIRRFEEKTAEMYTRGHIGGFTHLYIGQEAVAVGAVATLRESDYVVSNYREHGHCLAKGSDPKRIMAELFGKSTGLSRGKGGSMHLFDAPNRFLGGYAIVGAHLPLAAGVAFSSKYRGTDDVTLCFFGDGAVNEGAFHESLNLAALWALPVVYLLENNQFAMGTAVDRASAGSGLYARADAYGIPGKQVDGMDVLAVREAVAEAVERARAGQGPTLIEALTYRFRGHSMADPVYYRSKDDEELWKTRDPVSQFLAHLRSTGAADESFEREQEALVERIVSEAVDFATNSPPPDSSDLYADTCWDSYCPAYVMESSGGA